MSGIYPDNENLELFGETVSWPGVDENGKFTNGSFSDPAVRPSFIPAETINLILDNISELLFAFGKIPNNQSSDQLASAVITAIDAEAQIRAAADQALELALLTFSQSDENNVQEVFRLFEEIGNLIREHKTSVTLDHPDASVTAAKLAGNAVTTAKITDANVTTAKIADSAVTFAKIAAAAKSTTTPKANGTAAVGTESAFARGDHVHPTDVTKAALAGPTFSGTPKIGTNPVAVVPSTSTSTDTALPVGTYIWVYAISTAATAYPLNGAFSPYVNSLGNCYVSSSTVNGITSTALAGTWRISGTENYSNQNNGHVLLRRVS